jgi:hypothetical protein
MSSPAPPGAPRRDILGFFKAVVEFFTGITGVAAAGLTLLGIAITIALAPPDSAPGDSWVQRVNSDCVAVGELGSRGIAAGELATFATALDVLASGLRGTETPEQFRPQARSAAAQYERAASALRNGDVATAKQLTDNAHTTLAPLGVSC